MPRLPPVQSDAEFNTLFASLTQDVVTTAIHWRLYKDIWAAVPEFVRELNDSPALWSLTLNAHRELALFRLGRLYDQQSNALSLGTLLDRVRANLNLFDEAHFRDRLKNNPHVDSLARELAKPDTATLDEEAASVAASDPLVKRLVALRNRVLAHRDTTVILGTAKDPAKDVDGVDVDALLDRAANIVNRYSNMYRAEVHSLGIIGADDFKRVLTHVRSNLATTEREIEEEIKRATGAGSSGGDPK